MIISELFDDVGDKHQKKIAIDTVKNPNKSLLGGPSPEEAEKMLKDKFGMSDKQIQKLKEGTMGIGLLGDDPKEINKAGYELISKLKAPVKAENVYSFIEQRLSDDSLADSMYLMTKESYMDPRFKDSYGKHAKEIESIDARSILLHHLVGRDSALMYYGIGPALVGLYLAQQGVKAVAINMDMDLPGRNDEPLVKEKYGVNVDVLKKEIERMWGKLPDMDQYALTQTYKAIGGTPKITAPAESVVKEAMSNVDTITQLTDELYNELLAFNNEEYDEEVEELIGHLAEFKAKLEGDTGSFSEDYEKGRGPTGIAYAIKKGHPDAEDPKTGKKYPERQTPEYKKKFFKLNKEKIRELAPVVGALARAAGYGAANAVMDKIKKKFEDKDKDEVKTPGLRADPSKPAYIGKMRRHGRSLPKMFNPDGSLNKFYKKETNEAVGKFAQPIYDLIDELGDTDQTHANILHDLIRYLDGDQIKDFVDEFRRVHDYGNGKMEVEGKAKPDFLDLDKDGDKKEPMKKAAKDKEEMDEAHKATHVVVDPDGKVMGHATDEKGAKDIARDNLQNVKGKVFKLKKPASEKKADRMMGYKLDEPTESAELKSFKQLINQVI